MLPFCMRITLLNFSCIMSALRHMVVSMISSMLFPPACYMRVHCWVGLCWNNLSRCSHPILISFVFLTAVFHWSILANIWQYSYSGSLTFSCLLIFSFLQVLVNIFSKWRMLCFLSWTCELRNLVSFWAWNRTYFCLLKCSSITSVSELGLSWHYLFFANQNLLSDLHNLLRIFSVWAMSG